MTSAEEVVRAVHQNTPKNCTEISDKAPERVGCQIVFARHVLVNMVGRQAVNRAVPPEDQEDSNRDDDGNRKRFQIQSESNARHGHAEKDQTSVQAGRGKVDRNAAADGVPEEDEDIGNSKELAPLHEVLITLGVEEGHIGRMEHVEDGRPVLHCEVTQELCHEEGYHSRHPVPGLEQRGREVGRLQLRVAFGGQAREQEEPEGKAEEDVPVDVHHLQAEGGSCEAQDVDGCEACRSSHNGPGLRGPPHGCDDAQEGHFENPKTQARKHVGDENRPYPAPAQCENQQGRD
mmetsp:Transcript_61338/g.146235  ORF Transcript_61338/g.146235 Transcript_61338/m.146235 type:complete len:290 (+) Transcript_61338:418-1287(+)